MTATVFDQYNAPMCVAVVTWSSSNVSVATVSGQGLVTAVGNGGATITARSGSASASIPVTEMQSVGSMVVDPSSATLDGRDDPPAALLLDRTTGELRGMLEDLPDFDAGGLSARVVLPEPGLRAVTSLGLPDANDWER